MTQVSKQEYTVFRQNNVDRGFMYQRGSLQEVIESATKFYEGWGNGFRLIAWDYGSPAGKRWEQMLDASLRAGRLIEKIDGRWVARGAEEEKHDADRFTGLDADHDALDAVFGAGISHDRDDVFEDYCGPDGNAAMIARDDTQEARDFARVLSYIAEKDRVAEGRVTRTAKPNPFPHTLRNPDSCNGPADHLNASRHQMAGMSKS